MDVRASARYVRMSAKKIRPVIDVIRGLDVETAEDQLTLLPRSASRSVLKLLYTAIADAEHNNDLMRENLYVKSIAANEGPTAHRWMPKAFGRATPVRKRSAHIHMVLSEREEGKRGGRVRREEERKKKGVKKHKQVHAEGEKKEDHVHTRADVHAKKPSVAPAAASETPSRVAPRHDEGRGGGRMGFIKRIFNRKAG